MISKELLDINWIKEIMKFKEGDLVELIKANRSHPINIGTKVVIESFYLEEIHVRWGSYLWIVYEDEIELVPKLSNVFRRLFGLLKNK